MGGRVSQVASPRARSCHLGRADFVDAPGCGGGWEGAENLLGGRHLRQHGLLPAAVPGPALYEQVVGVWFATHKEPAGQVVSCAGFWSTPVPGTRQWVQLPHVALPSFAGLQIALPSSAGLTGLSVVTVRTGLRVS